MKLILYACLIFSCNSINTTPLQPDTIKVHIGDTFSIRLPSQIGTGNSWELAESYDKKLLEFVSKKYVDSKEDKDGSMGTDVFVFKALEKGSAALNFRYKRSWEKEQTTDKQKSYDIKIE